MGWDGIVAFLYWKEYGQKNKYSIRKLNPSCEYKSGIWLLMIYYSGILWYFNSLVVFELKVDFSQDQKWKINYIHKFTIVGILMFVNKFTFIDFMKCDMTCK